MELFRAHELMALVIGNEDYDWDAFEQSAKYKGGYTSGDPTVCQADVRSKFYYRFAYIILFFLLLSSSVDSFVLGSFS